jgi:hypothetical protein
VELIKGFEACGILSDVYVSHNRNARGHVFGFVCSIHMRDVGKLDRAMKNVFFGHQRAWANVARFDRFGGVGKELGEKRNGVRKHLAEGEKITL